jgi:predicted type IV restriction endonuclease
MQIADLDAVVQLTQPIASEIKTLSSRISISRADVSANETATRTQLIDPLLRVLGWEISDPNLVKPEYPVALGKRVDYALMRNSKPLALIEAKRLGHKLTAEDRLQAFGYASNEESVKFAIISNGDEWEMHQWPTSGSTPVASFSVSKSPSDFAAIEAAKIAQDVLIATIGAEKKHVERNPSSPGLTSAGQRPTGNAGQGVMMTPNSLGQFPPKQTSTDEDE